MDGYTYRIHVDSNGNVVLPALAGNARSADASLNSMAKGGNNASASLGSIDRSAGKANISLKRVAATLAAIGITLSAGAMAKSIVQTGVQFEKSMSNVAAISNATEEEFGRLKHAARDAGATTVFSATQAADAMGYLAQAGFKTNQMISAIPGTLNLAAAGSLEMAEAADIAANTLAQFGMKAEQSEVVADQLAYTANNFNTNVREISEAMKYFGPIAHSFGISLAESNAVIGLVANNGLKGSMATRALSTALTRLASPTKQMREMMDQLNLSFFDAKGNFVGFAEMVGRVEDATEGFTQQQKQEALSVIFGSEALKDMNPLINAGAEEIRKWTGELENAHGTASRMAAVKLDNLHGDMKLLESAAEEFSLSLYDHLQPSLRGMAKEATAFIASLDTKAIGGALGSFAKGIYSLTTYLIKNFDTIVMLGKGYITLKAAVLGYNTAMNLANTVTKLLNKTIMLSPWGLALAGISAVVAALALFKKKAEDTTLANQGVIDGLYKQRAEVNLLAAELQKAETPLNRRKEIIEELRRIQPSLVEGINAEAVAYATLTQNVEAYNRQKINEIVLEKKKGQLAGLQEAAADAMMRRENAEEKMPRLLRELYDGIDEKIRKKGSLSEAQKAELLEFSAMDRAKAMLTWENDKEYAGVHARLWDYANFRKFQSGGHEDLTQATRDEIDATRAAESFVGIVNEYAESIGTTLLGKVGGTTTDTITPTFTTPEPTSSAIPGAADASDKIVKGGSSQRIINITVHKFQDAINNYFNGGDGDKQRTAEEMEDAMNEMWLRILNSSNQLAR